MKVVMIVKTSHTMGFRGFEDAAAKKSMLIFDKSATPSKCAALEAFLLQQTGLLRRHIVATKDARLALDFDQSNLRTTLEVEGFVTLRARKARPGDCICSNESAYYPPLVKLQGSVPGVTMEGDVRARPLGGRWSIPDSQSAYLGIFDTEWARIQLALR